MVTPKMERALSGFLHGAGSYYGKGFKGGRGVTQGNPLSPTIFNVVVDAVVRHWLQIATQEAERRGERGREDQHQAALFYADDGMLASSDPRWLQWEFTQLVGMWKGDGGGVARLPQHDSARKGKGAEMGMDGRGHGRGRRGRAANI